MNPTQVIWMDGKFIKWEDAKVHILTHTLHYGLGVFEGIRFYKTSEGTALFRLKEHMDRLYKGAKTIFMKVPFSQKVLTEAVIQSVKKNKIDEGYCRPLLYYGYGKMGMSPVGAPPKAAIAVWSFDSWLGHDMVKVKTSSFIKLHPDSTHVDTKICGHYFNAMFPSMQAREAGFDEALLLDYEGNVAEASTENVFGIKDNKLLTPKLGTILPGITRDSIIQLAREEKYEVEEKSISLEELKSYDELFLTGTAAELSGIKQLDSTKFSNEMGPHTKKLKRLFEAARSGQLENFKNWLTVCK